MSMFTQFKSDFQSRTQVVFSLEDYLERAKTDKSLYMSPPERLIKAIGEPTTIDTAQDPRLSRIFQNKIIRVYPAFKDFYGLEDTIDSLVSFLRHAAQGLEERKQILYLLGPVGGGKSSIAETLKHLIEKEPIYVLAVEKEIRELSGLKRVVVPSPVFESPLGLFKKADSSSLGIPETYLKELISPWANKRLQELEGDITKFKVLKLYPSITNQTSVAKVEPGDENTQDISTLVGKIDIRKVAQFSPNDVDAYSFSGGLCRANQGLLEFVEMFKAPPKMLFPLLTATQEGNYNGTEAIGGIPFEGVILAHSNESEWQQFRNNKVNEAMVDRIYKINVPYCLRISDEIKIYEKLLRNSSLRESTVAPNTLRTLAEFSVLTRLKVPENSTIEVKARVYDGENVKEREPNAKSIDEYRKIAGVMEGFSGISTRFAFKVLSKTFNYDSEEIAANPVHLLHILRTQLLQEQLPETTYARYKEYIDGHLRSTLITVIEKEFQQAYLDAYDQYGQNMMERYFILADCWLQENDFRDPDTGEMFDKEALNKELSGTEKPAGISNPKDFRSEVVGFILRTKSTHGGKFPDWKSYRKLKEVIEKKMFASTETLLPIISFNTKTNKEDQGKHEEFVKRMVDKGYTRKQVKILTEWFLREKKS